ncbi:kinase-like domain-containing protein [Endogone sp. FLAS-F59071]|nr:kinase-like domain-containing protein [Endogone sp. FLAS-F59071]|eukprot:RUS16653.1 kinase-like domain-containing protein [Endogone sp. FLAS-F59071]
MDNLNTSTAETAVQGESKITSAETEAPTRETPLEKLRKVQLSKASQQRILANKTNFPGHEKELKNGLKLLEIHDDLAKFLVWIPWNRWTYIERMEKGSRSRTYQAVASSQDVRGFASPNNPDWPDNWHKIITDIYYDYEEQRRFILKEYSLEDVQMLHIQVISSVLMSTFAHAYDAVSLIGLTQRSANELPIVVMEMAQGGNMADWAKSIRGCSWKDIWKYATFLASGLSDFHKLGVVHGNLHARNVVIAGDKFLPYIIDFDQSQFPQRQQTDDDTTAFSVAHQLISQSSDIYSLGILLWQLVAGISARESVKDIPRTDELLKEPIPGVPRAYEDIYNSCWDPNPEKRPTAQQIFDNLVKAEVDIKVTRISSFDTGASATQKWKEEQSLQQKPASTDAIETDEEVFSRIRNMTKEQLMAFERDNQPIVRRYVENLTEERNRLIARHDELREIERRLDREVKQGFPSKMLRRMMGFDKSKSSKVQGRNQSAFKDAREPARGDEYQKRERGQTKIFFWLYFTQEKVFELKLLSASIAFYSVTLSLSPSIIMKITISFLTDKV